MARSCCGGGSVSTPSSPPPVYAPMMEGMMRNMDGSEYLLVQLSDGNEGDHPIVGFRTKTHYGYRKHGDQFLMHRDDVQAHMSPGQIKSKVMIVSIEEEEETQEPVQEDAEITIEKIEGVPAISALTLLSEKQVAELESKGILTILDLLKLSDDELMTIKGIAQRRVEQIREQAEKLLNVV